MDYITLEQISEILSTETDNLKFMVWYTLGHKFAEEFFKRKMCESKRLLETIFLRDYSVRALKIINSYYPNSDSLNDFLALVRKDMKESETRFNIKELEY